MALHRYRVIDAYTLEELRREYLHSAAKGRIRLLRYLQKHTWIPCDIARLAVEDQSVEVRQWIARHGDLRYPPLAFFHGEWLKENPSEELAERLKNDSDPFVRACVRENPSTFWFRTWDIEQWLAAFREASHLERLALVRNPNVGSELVKHIFKGDCGEFALDPLERKELAWAALSNSAAFESYSDETKAEIYVSTTNPEYRMGILWNCKEEEYKTLLLGMDDQNGGCRKAAFSTFLPNAFALSISSIRSPSYKWAQTTASELVEDWGKDPQGAFEQRFLRQVFEQGDKEAIRGLALNHRLTVQTLEKVREKLRELNDYAYDDAEATIRRLSKSPPEKNSRNPDGPIPSKLRRWSIKYILEKLIGRLFV